MTDEDGRTDRMAYSRQLDASTNAMGSAKSEASSSEVALVLSRIAMLGNVSP